MIPCRRMSFLHTIQCVSLFLLNERSLNMRYESFYPFSRKLNSATPDNRALASTISWASTSPKATIPRSEPNEPVQFPVQVARWLRHPARTSKIDGYMQTANRFLNTAQQFAPVVQQFAPMMRNLPAMWKLYKGFQSFPSAGVQECSGCSNAASRAAPATAQSSAHHPAHGRLFQESFNLDR